MEHIRPQKDPKEGQESVTDAVVADLHERRPMGIAKYGMELKSHNGRDALVDAYQEALDLCLYLKQALMEQGPLVTRRLGIVIGMAVAITGVIGLFFWVAAQVIEIIWIIILAVGVLSILLLAGFLLFCIVALFWWVFTGENIFYQF